MGPTKADRSGRRKLPLAAKILVAMLLGIVAGLVLGERADPLAKLGALIIDMIKGLAGPLLLFAVIDAFLRTEIRARSGARLECGPWTSSARLLRKDGWRKCPGSGRRRRRSSSPLSRRVNGLDLAAGFCSIVRSR